jgi:hypothetical protein
VKGNWEMMRRMGALLAAGLISITLVLPLRAQESPESRDGTRPAVKLKSEKTALLLSLFGTLGSYGLIAIAASADEASALGYLGLTGSFVGPSLGYFYGGLAGRGLSGAMARLAGMGGVVGGFAMLWEDENERLGIALMIVGGSTVIVSTVSDIIGVRRAVRKRNNRVQGLSLNVAPVIVPKSKTVGLTLQLGF